MPARVSAVHRGAIEVLGLDGSSRKIGLDHPGNGDDAEEWPPAVGDRIALSGVGPEESIAAILPRRTSLSRPSASRHSTEQAIAANVDVVAIVEPVQPEPAVGRIERFCALAFSCGAKAWLILTKADLVEADRADALAAEPGAKVDEAFCVSSEDPSSIAAVRDAWMPGETLVFIGRSGAGKTALTNALSGADFATAGVREGDIKGRHATTVRQLAVTGRGAIVDAPRVRALGATSDADAVDRTFEYIAELARECRFSDCTHASEPGCAVKQAVDAGELDPERLARYRALAQESERRARRRDARLAREEDRQASHANTSGRREAMRLKGRTN